MEGMRVMSKMMEDMSMTNCIHKQYKTEPEPEAFLEKEWRHQDFFYFFFNPAAIAICPVSVRALTSGPS